MEEHIKCVCYLDDPEKLKKWEAQQNAKVGSRPRTYSTSSSASYTRQEPRQQEASQPASSSNVENPVGAAFGGAVKAAGKAAGVAGAVAGVAGKAVGPAVGVAGAVAGVAGQTAKSVADNFVDTDRVARVAKMQLNDLLDFLSQPTEEQDAPSRGASWSTVQDIKDVEQEAGRLQSSIESLRADENSWDRRAKDFRASGDKVGEVNALKRFLDARDKRKGAMEDLLRCYDRIDDLRRR